jgi:hypothetical protein
MLLPLSPWHNNLTMTSWFWQHFWPTYAKRHASVKGHNLLYWLMHGDWHGLVKMASKKTFARAAMQGRWAPPLSLVQNIKNMSLIILVILARGSILLLKLH